MVRYIAENEEDFLTLQEPPPKAYLALLIGGRISHSFPLRGEVQMGREKGNAIVVADQKVSRYHALLSPVDKTFIIQDQGSANGTYVNGVAIAQPTRLRDHDRIGLGDTTFIFTLSPPSSELIEQPAPPRPDSPQPPQPLFRSPITTINSDNISIWMLIGCMAVAIVMLLLLLALLLGLFMGSNQVIGLLPF